MDSIRNPSKNSSNEDEESSVKISLSQHSLDEIQNLFDTFVEESKIDRVLSRFQPNVIKIYESLQKVLNNEADLYNKFLICKKDLNEINMKYAQAFKLSNIDNKAKTDLLEELEKAWNQTSVAKSKEKRALETINSLKLEIFNLSKLVEQGVGLTMGQEYNLREILKEKEKILTENTKLNEEILELRSEMDILAKKDDEYKQVIEESKVQVNQANQELLGCQLEIQKLTRKNVQLEEEIENQHILNDNLEKEKETKQKQTETLTTEKETVYLELKNSKNECANFQNQIKNLKNELESFRSDNFGLNGRLEQLTTTIKNFDKERIGHHENLNLMSTEPNQFNEKLKLY